MVINRHNYEEFFLLYVDNELNEPERWAVEQFVQENADLAAEMEMLKQAVLPGESIEFEQKEVLYNKANGISLENYEEYFLLAVDQELTKRENEDVEKFVLMHPELQTEYVLLEQTRLEPEAITFEGKGKLYKKEGREKPVVFISWMRISAAAAVVGLLALGWIFSQNENSVPSNPLASTDKVTKIPGVQKQGLKPVVIDKGIASLPAKERENDASKTTRKQTRIKAAAAIENRQVLAAQNVKNKNNLPGSTEKREEHIESSIPNRESFENAIASAKIEKNNQSVLKEDPDNGRLMVKSALEKNSPLTTQAVYREIDTQENDEDNTFYIGSAEINKNKLKGLFKKAASLFDRKSNNDDGERTLKIAGFEIKSK